MSENSKVPFCLTLYSDLNPKPDCDDDIMALCIEVTKNSDNYHLKVGSMKLGTAASHQAAGSGQTIGRRVCKTCTGGWAP